MDGEVRRWMGLLAVFAIVLTACGSGGTSGGGGSSRSPTRAASTAPSPSGSCQSRAGLTGKVDDRGTKSFSGSAVELQAGDFFFSPTCVGGVGGSVTVTVENGGQALHNFSITSLGIDQDVPSGQSITVEVQLPASGVLPFFCKYHVGAGQQGAFLVGGAPS